MGGSGSTRWDGYTVYRCIGEETIAISAKSLAPLLGSPDGTTASVKKAGLGTLRFAIVTIPRRRTGSAKDRPCGDKKIAVFLYDFDEPIGSVIARAESAPFGGVRWWLLCYTCRECRNQLFMVDDRFWRCRVCLGLKYWSQRLDPVYRLGHRCDKIMRRIGGDGTWVPGKTVRSKPKGMHWRTFDWYQRQLAITDARRDHAFLARHANWFNRVLRSRRELSSLFDDTPSDAQDGESSP